MAADPPLGSARPDGLGSFVDVTLLDELAALTPEERLRLNDRMIATVLELRNGFAAAGAADAARPAGGERAESSPRQRL